MKSFKTFSKEKVAPPLVYLDMDGVLFDFFGAWLNLRLKKSQNESWEILKHLPPIEVKKDLEEIGKDSEDFYSNLEPLPGGEKILAFLRENNIKFKILSAPLPNSPGSILGKKKSLEKIGLQDTPATFTSDKWLYAITNNTPNILVDDFGDNIKKWEEAGGVGIKHDEETTDNTISLLTKYILEG